MTTCMFFGFFYISVLCYFCSADADIVNAGKQPKIDPLDYVDDVKLVGDERYRNAMRSERGRWKNGIVPYVKSSRLDSDASAVIDEAIRDFHKYTCIKWVQKQSRHSDYINFISGDGCYSYVGRTGGRQEISMDSGCDVKGIAIHEMMHALGFYHEQNRGDRDSYVRIDFSNIRSYFRKQFKKLTDSEENNLGTKYDYSSVMHYTRKAFAKDKRRDTVIPKDPNVEIGQRRGFSVTDLVKINKLYNCPEKAKNSQTPSSSPKSPTTKKPSPTKPVTASCKDDYQEWWCRRNRMGWWQDRCKSSHLFRTNCRKTCQLCSQPSTQECTDKNRFCSLRFLCSVYGRTECRKSCNYCT